MNAGIWVILRLCWALWSSPQETKQTFKTVFYPWRLLYNPRLSFWSHWNDWYQCLDLMYNEVYSVGGYRVVPEKVKRPQVITVHGHQNVCPPHDKILLFGYKWWTTPQWMEKETSICHELLLFCWKIVQQTSFSGNQSLKSFNSIPSHLSRFLTGSFPGSLLFSLKLLLQRL